MGADDISTNDVATVPPTSSECIADARPDFDDNDLLPTKAAHIFNADSESIDSRCSLSSFALGSQPTGRTTEADKHGTGAGETATMAPPALHTQSGGGGIKAFFAWMFCVSACSAETSTSTTSRQRSEFSVNE